MTMARLKHSHKRHINDVKVNIISLLSKVVLNVANYQFVPAVRVRFLSYISVQLCSPLSPYFPVPQTPVYADHLNSACEHPILYALNQAVKVPKERRRSRSLGRICSKKVNTSSHDCKIRSQNLA